MFEGEKECKGIMLRKLENKLLVLDNFVLATSKTNGKKNIESDKMCAIIAISLVTQDRRAGNLMESLKMGTKGSILVKTRKINLYDLHKPIWKTHRIIFLTKMWRC